MDFRYTRVFSDDLGESHFDDVDLPLDIVDFAPPAEPLGFASLGEAQSAAVIGSDKDWRGAAFHPAPARQLLTLLCGAGSITVSDGETREFGAGHTILLEDTDGRGHSSHFFDDVMLLVVRLAPTASDPR